MATQDRTVARASVLFEPTDWLSNYTVAIYSHRDERPAAQISGSDGAIAPCPINLPSCIYGPAYADELAAQADRGIRTVSIPLDTVQYDEPWMFTNILSARFGDITVKYRSEEHTSELQSLMRISYADFCLKKKNKT